LMKVVPHPQSNVNSNSSDGSTHPLGGIEKSIYIYIYIYIYREHYAFWQLRIHQMFVLKTLTFLIVTQLIGLI
ncbi:MAG: hypothetical protein N7Q72_06690, partial [Spiroplasma sp. Tabriz.8]|nr:hypothetical protein [Spiroplasma sp. Tabriz.8]